MAPGRHALHGAKQRSRSSPVATLVSPAPAGLVNGSAAPSPGQRVEAPASQEQINGRRGFKLGVKRATGHDEKNGKSPRSPTRASPNQRPRCADDLTEDNMPSIDAAVDADEFVEGGVELSPNMDGDWFSMEGKEQLQEAPTRSLLELTDEEFREVWPSVAGPKALFLDYDGTLREFEARPEMATPTREILDLLERINAREDLIPHIISGRDSKFLEENFGRFSRFVLVAEHGFQISQAASPEKRSWCLWEQHGSNTRNKDHEHWKKIMREEVERLIAASPGSHLEEKRSALVWHYREVTDQAQAEALALRAVDIFADVIRKEKLQDVKIMHGHKVVEVSHKNVRKGLVMRKLCEEKSLFGEPYAAVLAAGDDVSDETMFDVASDDFLTIKVGLGPTVARFRVESPVQLRQFLQERILA
mmetsp:Transcript_89541/g.256452  ORF Transcript_89541/g.256452 Transcript_89541/m.256452 type:complete len:419 (+) Transcript_89541:79-1335(+)|eukprot:CAMPEP_0177217066 /NCGR_PEP_ID=MMETSP0367-20130122/35088_1 /TAXON_ID=447022 ORGANISM="Scrippsiella hangoei-like, Strain SHHI-4" /NCGR_SAMPLE_ID=MMETSP0367 /ASSEMBLY_ACC=CAM_ASM_000362 /LENGTH=418 /DNA_ID=CAMNT_0018666615 /DNA_START=46 /DNA_END=1302 /DNA_ORIENTATION=-